MEMFSSIVLRSFTNSGMISGSGSMTKSQGGTLIFSGSSANTYLGNTVVNAGVLQLSKSVPGAISTARSPSATIWAAATRTWCATR